MEYPLGGRRPGTYPNTSPCSAAWPPGDAGTHPTCEGQGVPTAPRGKPPVGVCVAACAGGCPERRVVGVNVVDDVVVVCGAGGGEGGAVGQDKCSSSAQHCGGPQLREGAGAASKTRGPPRPKPEATPWSPNRRGGRSTIVVPSLPGAWLAGWQVGRRGRIVVVAGWSGVSRRSDGVHPVGRTWDLPGRG